MKDLVSSNFSWNFLSAWHFRVLKRMILIFHYQSSGYFSFLLLGSFCIEVNHTSLWLVKVQPFDLQAVEMRSMNCFEPWNEAVKTIGWVLNAEAQNAGWQSFTLTFHLTPVWAQRYAYSAFKNAALVRSWTFHMCLMSTSERREKQSNKAMFLDCLGKTPHAWGEHANSHHTPQRKRICEKFQTFF